MCENELKTKDLRRNKTDQVFEENFIEERGKNNRQEEEISNFCIRAIEYLCENVCMCVHSTH